MLGGISGRFLVVLWFGRRCVAEPAQPSQLSNLHKYNDQLEAARNKTIRVENVDVLPDESTSFCHIVDLNFHSFINRGSGARILEPSRFAIQGAAAIALALEHLNSGNGYVVKELEGLNDRCDIRFTSEFRDTAMSALHTLDELIELVTPSPDRQLPCAFLGAALSTNSMSSATFTGIKGYPQLSWLSVSSKLDDKQQYPLFARLTPSLSALSFAYLKLLYHELDVRNVALVHSDEPTLLEGATDLQGKAKLRFPSLHVHAIPFSGTLTDDTIAQTVVEKVQKTGLRYVVLFIDTDDVEPFLKKMGNQQQHVWFILRPPSTLLNRKFQADDPLLPMLQGSFDIEPLIGARGVGMYDRFIDSWTQIGSNEADMNYIQSLLPMIPDSSGYQQGSVDASVFAEENPFAARAYDATVLMGLAACSLQKNNFTGAELNEAMFNISFIGATGEIGLDPITRARKKGTDMFSLKNTVAVPSVNGTFVLSQEDVSFLNGTDWLRLKDPIFPDGTSNIPADLPPIEEDKNHISMTLRIFGLVLATFVVASSGGMCLWSAFFKDSRVVRASQPFFLYLICFGTGLMGLSIVTLVLDDGFTNQRVADHACMLFPWLLALGWCISFSALFSKTMRINKLFHNPRFRRLTVSVSDVLWPMAILMIGTHFRYPHNRSSYFHFFLSIQVNTIVLLIWTLVSPLRFERVEVSTDAFGRTEASRGYCGSDLFLPFVGALMMGNLIPLFIAMYQAYVARKLTTEFAETDYIARAMSLIAVAALLVVPVAFIAGEDPNLYCFLTASFVGIVSLSLILFIFLPKILIKSRRSLTEAVRTSMTVESPKWKLEDSDTSGGELILLHPKANEELRSQNETLKDKVAVLKTEIATLEDRLVDLGGGSSEMKGSGLRSRNPSQE